MQVDACIMTSVIPTDDAVFKALADPTRRALLDRLHAHDGLSLNELCDGLGMARQSATQHLAVLEAANLVVSVRRGRQKLHHLNPVPLHEIQERWIDKFERPRLRSLAAIKRGAEHAMTEKHTYVYVTYIEATAEAVWHALTDAEVTAQYWGHRNVSDWEVGSPWAHRQLDSDTDDVIGTVLENDRPHRLVHTWASPDDPERNTSRVTYDLAEEAGVVRLTVTHEDLDDQGLRDVSGGWPAVCANLKSLLETGSVLPELPWVAHPT